MKYPRTVPDPVGGQLSESTLWNLREVAPGLYVGGQVTPIHDGFDTVIDLAGQDDPSYKKFRKVLHWTFTDGLPVPEPLLDAVWDLLQKAQGPVLIHCAEGRSRSVSVAYAMLRRQGQDHEAAYAAVCSTHGPPVPTTFNSVHEWVNHHVP